MAGISYFIDSQVPRTLVAMTRSNISSSASAIAVCTWPVMPALL